MSTPPDLMAALRASVDDARRRRVMTPATLARVPNAPGTPRRTIRVSDDLWAKAQAKAEERGEDLSAVIRAALVRYVKRK